MKQRIQYLDVCKGIGIILVVLGHIIITNPIRTWIYSFHMPLFFFLSGYIFCFSKTSSFKNFVNKRLKTIVVPYFVFAFFFYIYWLLIEIRFRTEGLSVNKLKPLIGIFYGNGPWLTFNIVLWFLPCLFITEITFYLIIKFTKEQKYVFLILFISSIIGYLISIYLKFRLPWDINIMCTSIVFYGLGYILHESNLDNKLTTMQESIFIILLLSVNIPIAFINKAVDMDFLTLGNYFLYYIAAISGTLFLYLICKKIKHCNWLSFLGKNSLIIMCIHDPLKRIIIKIVSVVSKISTDTIRNSILGSLLCLSIILLISVIAIYIINNYMPFIIGKQKIEKNNIYI